MDNMLKPIEIVCFSSILLLIVLFGSALEEYSSSKASGSSEISDRKYVIVATIDGNLTAIDFITGQVYWTLVINKNSFLSSSLSNLQVKENEKLLELVPSLDGYFFKYDKFKLTSLNVTVEDLLYGDKALFPSTKCFGGKFKFVVGINQHTGEVGYNCSLIGCEHLQKIVLDDMLLVEEYQQSISSIDSVTAEERWSLKISELHITGTTLEEMSMNDIFYSELNQTVEKNALVMRNAVNFNPLLNRIKISLSKGIVALHNENSNEFSWFYKTTSSIIDAWFVDKNVYQLNPFDSGSDFFELKHEGSKYAALLFLGSYLDQLFIIRSKRHRIKSANSPALIKEFSYEAYCLLRTNMSESSFIHPNKTNALIPANAYITDAGHYFYLNFSVYENETHCIVGFSYPKYSDEIMDSNFWWKLVLILLLLVSVSLGFLLGYIHVKKNSNKDSAAYGVVDLVYKIQTDEEFISRFHKEFHFLTVLGRGGFGVVMEAKNKIDDCDYAVKRIRIIVDGRKEQRYDGVLREVKALAKLDHPHIVRYFNSWVENPPEGWQDEKDKELSINDVTFSISHTSTFGQDCRISVLFKPKENERKVSFKTRSKHGENIKEKHFSDQEKERAAKIADKLKANPFGDNFGVSSFDFSSQKLSGSQFFETNNSNTIMSSSSTYSEESSMEEFSDSSAHVIFIDDDIEEHENSNLNVFKIESLKKLFKYVQCYENGKLYENIHIGNSESNENKNTNIQFMETGESSNADTPLVYDSLCPEDEVFELLKLVNNCLACKMSLEDIDILHKSLFSDSTLAENDDQSWLNYISVFHNMPKIKILTKLYEIRIWIISVLSIFHLFDSYHHNLLKINLCNILWDINLTIENSPCSFSSAHNSRFTGTNHNDSFAKSAVLSHIKDFNLSLAWPMKKKYLLQFSIFLFYDDYNQQWTKWKSIFSQNDHSIYIKNLRLLQIWIISILTHFNSHKDEYFLILLSNLSKILFQLNKLLTKEAVNSNMQDYPFDAYRSLFCSTTYFLEMNVSSKKDLMFHQVQIQKTLRTTMLKKYNKPGYLYIQMQLCQRESFESWLKSHSESRNYDEVMKIFLQIVDAIDYVHTSGLMHRDLKPSNIYFSKEGLIKIGDFGLATRFEVQQEGLDVSSSDIVPSHTYGIGTPTYLSPEQCYKRIYNSKTDMYSLGLIFYELLMPMKTGFEKNERFASARCHIFPVHFIQQYPKECELIRRLLSYDPDQRPSGSELKCHPLFQPYIYQLKN